MKDKAAILVIVILGLVAVVAAFAIARSSPKQTNPQLDAILSDPVASYVPSGAYLVKEYTDPGGSSGGPLFPEKKAAPSVQRLMRPASGRSAEQTAADIVAFARSVGWTVNTGETPQFWRAQDRPIHGYNVSLHIWSTAANEVTVLMEAPF